MRLQKRFLYLYFGFLAIASCGPAKTPAVPITLPISTKATNTLTSMPQIHPQTPTAFVIPSATIATVAVVPTLETNQAYSFLQRLIEGSPNCQLPCWAGIKPEVTSDTEAQTLVGPLSILIYGGQFHRYKDKAFSGPGGGRDFLFGDTKIRFYLSWYFEQGKNTIELLRIRADILKRHQDGSLEPEYGNEPYNQLFRQYNLHNILSQYGIPSQVWTIAEVYYYGNDKPDPRLPEEFNLLLFYDKGILIHYKMPLKRMTGARGKACPSEAFFDMMLVPPGMSEFYQGMMFSSITDSPSSSPYMPIEKSTQMTFDEFYQSFKESNNPCFEIPLTIWPQH